jgi:hypothetical protein
MSRLARNSLVLWIAGALVYAGFLAWYDGWHEPLSDGDVDRVMQAVEQMEIYRGNDAIKARLRSFLEADDGREFFMVNLLSYRAVPQAFEGMREGETPQEVMRRYSGAFMPAILGRAGWMVSGGRAAAADLEHWGVETDRDWEYYGLIRYRSRRDLAEVIIDPAFHDIHPYKFAALEATRAFPVSPALVPLSPRLVVALSILVIVLLAQNVLLFFGRKA